MTYEQTLEFLFLQHASIYRGLKRIRYVLEKLGNPQERFPSVLITGTNGKGSTAKMLSSILTKTDYRVGCFTSPHLIDFRERITINEEYISRDEVVEFTELIRRGPLKLLEQEREQFRIEGSVSFFEIVTAMAFLHFARHKIDIAILEVGIGGRLDATNTANPLVSVITNVGLDHQKFLGYTVEEIAQEKSAIIRKQGDVVIGCQKPEVIAVIEKVCRQQHATLYRTGIYQGFSRQRISQARNVQFVGQENRSQFSQTGVPYKLFPTGSRFSFHGLHSHFDDLHLPLVGLHQLANATVALSTLELLAKKGFHVREEEVRAGLSHVVHPGRLEMIHAHPRVVVDIAHNFMGASAIAKTLTSIFAYDRLIVVIGILHDKDVQGILRPFLEIADTMIFTSPHNTDRAKTASATAQVAEELVRTRMKHISGMRSQTSQYDHWCKYEIVEDALNQACSIAGKHDLICVTGSNYTVSEAEMYFSTRVNA